jgi:hypothetical protein
MSTLTTTQHQQQRVLTGILECAVAALELTPAQRKCIEETYRDCGEHLGKSLGISTHLADIFPQGSMRLGTVIRPFRDITEVFDLDVVFLIALLCTSRDPEALRVAVGTHLRTKYNGVVKPLPKGWRLDFSTERDYYLDIIPAMNSVRGGNVVAITDGAKWRDSNPRDYAGGFEAVAAKLPRYEGEVMLEKFAALANDARIEPLPEYTQLKSPLQRIVQISKRYRDYYFNKKVNQPGLLPASIIVTTLLMKAYSRNVHSRAYASGFDLLVTCVEDMPAHLEIRDDGRGGRLYALPNPSLPTENLVEKWSDPKYAEAFFRWHRDFLSFLRALLQPEGAHRQLLSEALGEKAVNTAFARQADSFSAARQRGVLSVETSAGLTLGTTGIVSSKYVIHGVS